MGNKILIIGISIFVLLIITGVLISSGILKINGNVIKETENSNPELEKYRSENIPEDCRLPIYENDLDWWKQHLSHHKETLYCLDYYK